ncbi:MAG: glycoside hydrolase family 28 protein, partial [Planctomycetota bacterium]
DTAAVQAAIDTASAEGRTLLIPKGTFRCGSLELKSNLHMVLSVDSVILGSKDMADYTPAKEDQFCNRTGSDYTFLHSYHADNITIEGPGTIDGNLALDESVHKRGRGPMMMIFEHGTNITLKGMTAIRSASWAITFYGCQRVRVLQVNVLESYADGIDPVCCQDVLIDGCTIDDNGDDCICLKNESCDMTTATAPAWGFVTRYVRITNCLIRNTQHGHPAIKLGTGSFGIFSDILIANCTVENLGSLLSIDCMRPTLPETKERYIERVSVHDCTANGVFNLLDIKVSAVYEPVVRDITMSRILCREQRHPNRLVAPKDSPIRNVSLQDIQVSMAELDWRPVFCKAEQVEGLSFRNITVTNGKQLSAGLLATHCSTIEGYRLGFDTLCNAESVMSLNSCSQVVLDRIKAPEVKTILKAEGEATKGLMLREIEGTALEAPISLEATIPAEGWSAPQPSFAVEAIDGPSTLDPGEEACLTVTLAPAATEGALRLAAMSSDTELGALWCWRTPGAAAAFKLPINAPYLPGSTTLQVGDSEHALSINPAPARFEYEDLAEFTVPAGESAVIVRGVTNVGGERGTCTAECRRGDEVFTASVTLDPGEAGQLRWELPAAPASAPAIELEGLPAWPWLTTGNVPGHFSLSSEALTIEAGGRIGEHEDYAAVYRTLTGDFDLIGRFRDIDNTGEYCAQGMILRNDLTDCSSTGYSAYAFVPKYGGMYRWCQDRDGDGHYDFVDMTKAWPLTKLTRRGQHLTLYGSPDGVEWEERTSCDIESMNEAIDVGFYANAYSIREELTRTVFRDIQVAALEEVAR